MAIRLAGFASLPLHSAIQLFFASSSLHQWIDGRERGPLKEELIAPFPFFGWLVLLFVFPWRSHCRRSGHNPPMKENNPTNNSISLSAHSAFTQLQSTSTIQLILLISLLVDELSSASRIGLIWIWFVFVFSFRRSHAAGSGHNPLKKRKTNQIHQTAGRQTKSKTFGLWPGPQTPSATNFLHSAHSKELKWKESLVCWMASGVIRAVRQLNQFNCLHQFH